MFENFAVNASDNVRGKFEELRNIVLEDPMYKEFVQNGGNFETLHTYVQSNRDLSYMVSLMSGALDEFGEAQNTASILMPSYAHRGICWLNRINGYEIDKKISLYHVDEGQPEVTEKTAGASMIEKVYDFMEERNYRDIQTDPNALMLIHLAHLGEKMMDKVAEIARLSELESAEKSMDIPQEDVEQKEFYNKLTDPQDLEYILDEEKMEKKLADDAKKIEQNSQIIEKFYANDPGTKKAVLEAAMAKHPERPKHVQEVTLQIQKKYAQKKAQELEKEVAKYRADITRKNEDNKFINDEIVSENLEKSQFNATLDEKIRELEESREEKLKGSREKEAKAAKVRQQREEEFKKIVDDYYAKKDEVPDRVKRLEYEAYTLAEYSKIGGYVANPDIVPPKSHFDEVAALQKKYDAVDYVRDLMFHLSGNDRNAKDALEMLSPNSVKTVKELKKKLNTASREEETAADKLLAETDTKKQPDLLEKANAATKKRLDIQNQFEPWKNASDLQDALADLWKNNADLKKEFDGITKKTKKNTYEALKVLGENYEKKIDEKKDTYREYYTNMAKYEQLSFDIKNKNLRSLEDMGTIGLELLQAQKELSEIVKPDKKQFDMETEARCNEIYNKKVEEKNVESINKSTDEAIKKLQDQRLELEELRPVFDEKTINKMVDEKKAELDKILTWSHEAYAMAETNDILNAESAELMNGYINNLKDVNHELRNLPGRLTYKKETAEKNYQKTKDAYIKQQAVKEKWEQVKTKESPFVDMMEKELASLSGSMLKGKKEGHNDTKEFNDMKGALEVAHEYLKQNKAKISALDENSVTEFKKLLTDMSAKSSTYYDLKQKGIHWRPSNMRFVRLSMSKRLQSTAADMSDRIDKMQEIKQKEAPIQSKADTFHVEDPGENYKEYTIHQAPKETVAKLNEKLAAEKASKDAKVNQKQNGKDLGLGGKK